MATLPKTPGLNDNREPLNDVLLKERLEKIKKYTHAISEANEKLDALNKLMAMIERIDALNKTSSLVKVLDDLNKTTGLNSLNRVKVLGKETHNLNKVASKAFLSFNLYPVRTLDSSLKNINYPASLEQALARDWQNVGNDLWKSCLKVSDNPPSDKDE